MILETIAGKRSIADAAAAIGVGEARFHELRTETLQAALDSLAPRPAGRPTQARVEEDPRIAELEERVRDLDVEIKAAHVREQIALTMPHLLQPAEALVVASSPPGPGTFGADGAYHVYVDPTGNTLGRRGYTPRWGGPIFLNLGRIQGDVDGTSGLCRVGGTKPLGGTYDGATASTLAHELWHAISNSTDYRSTSIPNANHVDWLYSYPTLAWRTNRGWSTMTSRWTLARSNSSRRMRPATS